MLSWGGHVLHWSIWSLVEALPCICVEKWKHSTAQGISIYIYKGQDDLYDLPNKARIVEKPSIASTSSYINSVVTGWSKLNRMFWSNKAWRIVAWVQMARKWQVLVSSSSLVFNNNTTYLKYYLDCAVPVFTRPAPTTCSCSIASTCTSGDNTPPLLLFNRSSISGGLQSSINLSQIILPFLMPLTWSPYAYCWKKQGLHLCSRHWIPTEVLQISHFTLLHV